MRLEEVFLNDLAQSNLVDMDRPPMRIDITGVGQPTAPEEVGPAPDLSGAFAAIAGGAPISAAEEDITEFATQMAAGTEPAGAAPMSLREFATSAADVPAGLLKGAVQGTVGLPGDIESIAYGVREIFNRGSDQGALEAFLSGLEQKTVLPTTENVKAWLDTNVGPLVPAGASERRREAAKIPEFVGELGGAGTMAIEGTRAVGRGINVGAMAVADRAVQAITGQPQATAMGALEAAGQMAPLARAASPRPAAGLKTLEQLIEEPFKVEPSVATLSQSFTSAIDYFKGLDKQQQAVIAQMADDRLAQFVGRTVKGKTNKMLTSNGKLQKTEKGGKGKEPIKLPDGRGVENAGLALSPAFKIGKFSTCPNSASCEKECLGKTANGYYIFGGGADLDALGPSRERGFRMTQAMFREPEAFAIKLHNEITSLKRKAEKNGNMLAIRLNVLSDINPRIHKALIEAHPDVAFYDYTKNNTNPVAPNHHYTYSSTGVSQPAGYNGLKVDVTNENTNWKSMRRRLDQGSNVAMAFSHKRVLPETVLDEETGKIYKVIDGDAYDFRPMDIQPAGTDGVIIGLKNKAITRKEAAAATDSSGFFVQYDPQIKRAGGKQVRDEFGVPVAGNTQVRIAPQQREQITLTNDGQSQGVETGIAITERARQ
jgi:hypothetical protein